MIVGETYLADIFVAWPTTFWRRIGHPLRVQRNSNDGTMSCTEAGLAVFFKWKLVTSGSLTTDVMPLYRTNNMNLYRLFTEAYILHCIGELDGLTASRLLERCVGSPYETIDDAIRDFEQTESVSIALVEWVRTTWNESEKQTPKQFAKSIYDDFRASLW